MKLTDDRILELRAKQLPRATSAIWSITIKPDTIGDDLVRAHRTVEHIDRYLHDFVADTDGCINCGAKQGVSGHEDWIASMLGGTPARFEWGIQHGEGFCSACGWPGRAMHYIGDKIQITNWILQYHPDCVLLKSERKQAASLSP